MNINKIVIAGAGTMGYSMAQIFAQFHYQVMIYDFSDKAIENAKKRISENIDILIDEKEITSQQGQEIMSYLSYTTSKDCFKDCDLVVENIIENVDIKNHFIKTYLKLSLRIVYLLQIHQVFLLMNLLVQ